MEQSQTSCESNEADWLVWLDEELQSLPSTLRDALVMCEMEDLSRAEAAKRLRIPEGTLSSRLARGKAMLRDRLRRRGVLLSFAALGLAMSSSTQAEASGSLIQNTVQAAVGAGASAPVAALAEGVISTMFLQKLLVGAVVIVFGLVGATGLIGTTGLWIGSRALAAQDQLELARRAELNQNKATKDEDALQGEWEVISVGKVGKKIENDEEAKIKRKTFVFKGDKFISAGEAKFTLDPSKTPKEMDIVPAEGPEGEKGKTFRAIYELKGNDLKITFNGPDQARPKAFDDDGAVAMVLKRSKDKK